jgi:RNA polymerase sigma-70 factor (ECF subfamily)
MTSGTSRPGAARLRLVGPEKSKPGDTPGRASPSLDDSELLAAMRAGEKRVAPWFHDRVRPQVDRTLRRLFGRDDRDFDDLRQQALMELVFTIHRFRGECSLDRWVSTVTGHVVYNHLRKRRMERRFFDLLEREDLFPRSVLGTPKEALVRSLVRQASQHLATVDPRKAWAFVLHDVLGYDLVEIAHTMETSVSAAQTRLVRGRREVHERLAADPDLARLLEEIDQWP